MTELQTEFFRKQPFPKAGSKEWLRLVNNSHDFGVCQGNSGVFLARLEEPEVKVQSLFAFGGTFQAVFKGEWGGQLEFIEGGSKTIIKEGCIKFLFELNGNLFFIDTLSHMGLDYGVLYQIFYRGSIVSYELLLDLEESVEAICLIGGGSIAAISGKNFFFIEKSGLKFVKRIVQELEMEFSFPNSLLRLSQDVFLVGVRGGVGKVDLRSAKVEFYKYSSTSNLSSKDYLVIEQKNISSE